MHFMKKKQARDGCFCALKLDIRKAYDKLEWDYLQKVIIKLDFHRLWVDMIIRRVNSVSFSLILNGSKLDTFKPSRGIRQGDPISPYLFLLAAEGLQASSNFVLGHQTSWEFGWLWQHRWWVTFYSACCFSRRIWRMQKLWRMHWICTVKLHGNRLIWRSWIHFAKGRNNDTCGEIKAILKVHNETLSESILLSQRQGVAESVGVDGAMPFRPVAKRCWSRPLPRPFQCTRCHALGFQGACASILIVFCATSGGAANKEKGRLVGSLGMICWCQKVRMRTVSRTSSYSTWPCWHAMCGASYRTRVPLVQGYWKQPSFL